MEKEIRSTIKYVKEIYKNLDEINCNELNNNLKNLGSISYFEDNEFKQYCKYNIYGSFYRTHKSYLKDNRQTSFEDWIKNRTKMKCLFCNHIQNINKSCKNCKEKFSRNYCNKCKFHYNEKNIRHCDTCNLCYDRDKIIHCSICRKCVSKEHNCITTMIKDNKCSICDENLKEDSPYGDNNFKEPFVHEICNGIFHKNCMIEFYKHSGKKCPNCRNSFIFN
jgi:hypothetical protein